MINTRLQRKRDTWERKVVTAFLQKESMKRNFNVYESGANDILKAYEEWLKQNKVEPILDINRYK